MVQNMEQAAGNDMEAFIKANPPKFPRSTPAQITNREIIKEMVIDMKTLYENEGDGFTEIDIINMGWSIVEINKYGDAARAGLRNAINAIELRGIQRARVPARTS